MTQYGSSSPSTIMPYVVNHCTAYDDYIAMQTGDSEYTAIIGDYDDGSITGEKFVISREGNYSSAYTVEQTSVENESVSYSNEYYVISNVGIGQAYNYSNGQRIEGANIFILGVLIVTVFVSGVCSIWRKVKRR